MSHPADFFSIELLRQIIASASSARSLRDYVDRLVDKLHEVMHVRVSSLYLVEENRQLRLIASVGLSSRVVGELVLGPHQGLVGSIAASRRPLNLGDASSHRDFHFVPRSGEDPHSAFLGVPIEHLGEVIGVLIVQDDREEPFTSHEEALLLTVAAQLAGSLVQWHEHSREDVGTDSQLRLRGISGAPGVAIGKVHLALSGATLAAGDPPPSGGAEQELTRLTDAIGATRRELQAAISRLQAHVTPDVTALFEVYESMLTSTELLGACERRILAGESAVAAARGAIDELSAAFLTIEDEYLKARSEDLSNIGTKLLRHLLEDVTTVPDDATDVVLLGDLVSITDIAQLGAGQLAGVVSMAGSNLSHTAILARALGAPAVMGIGHVEHVNEADEIIVDGNTGTVVLRPLPAVVASYQHLIDQQSQIEEELAALRDLPAVTPDGEPIQLLANTGLLADAEPGLTRGAQGIGLYRSEIPFLIHSTFPTEDEQIAIYHQVLQIYHPKPVVMRILDVGGDKALPYLTIDEDNPVLGWRGIRFALDNRSVLLTQIRAMLLADEGLGNLKLMLPMVSSVQEIVDARTLIDETVLQLQGEGRAVRTPPLGVMVEVPAIVGILDHAAPLISFLSIGTNDLTQYLLAVDRTNPRVASRFDHLHPSVIQTIATVVHRATRLGLECTVCGEMAADPEALPLLIGAGVRKLSMNAYSLPRIKKQVRALPLSKAKSLFEAASKLPDEKAIRALVRENVTH